MEKAILVLALSGSVAWLIVAWHYFFRVPRLLAQLDRLVGRIESLIQEQELSSLSDSARIANDARARAEDALVKALRLRMQAIEQTHKRKREKLLREVRELLEKAAAYQEIAGLDEGSSDAPHRGLRVGSRWHKPRPDDAASERPRTQDSRHDKPRFEVVA